MLTSYRILLAKSAAVSVLFLQLFCTAQAQQFAGEVFMRDEGAVLLNQVYITNLAEQRTVLSDYTGNFSIAAKPGDIVRFTSIISERLDVRITPELLSKKNFVELKWQTYRIEEVVLPRFKVTGNLRKDLAAIKIDDRKEKIKNFIGLPKTQVKDSAQLPPLLIYGGGGIGLSIDAIYGYLSGERKKMERLYAYEKMSKSVRKVHQYFGTDYFVKLKIPAHLTDNFLQFVYTSDNFYSAVVEENNPEAVQPLIEKYLPVYRKRLETSGLLQISPDQRKN